MQKTGAFTTTVAALGAIVTLAALSTPARAVHAQVRSSVGTAPAWDAFSAEVAIRQSTVDADGRPAGPAAPATTVRLDRRLEAGQWRTTLTLQSRERPEIRGLARAAVNPFDVVRVEYDENGTPPRMYDPQGRLVRLPDQAARRLLQTPAVLAAGLSSTEPAAVPVPRLAPLGLAGEDWIAALTAPANLRPARRAALDRQFGPPSGRIRGLDRYVGWVGADTLEVLVDPDEALPVEINHLRGGEFIARTTLAHSRDTSGLVRQRSARTERMHPDGSGHRTVTEVVLSNIQIGAGGGR